ALSLFARKRNCTASTRKTRACMKALPRISVFPKCWFDDLCAGRRDYLQWLRDAKSLDAEGVEHYDGFFRSLDDAGIEPVRHILHETGQTSSMLCFSPHFPQ